MKNPEVHIAESVADRKARPIQVGLGARRARLREREAAEARKQLYKDTPRPTADSRQVYRRKDLKAAKAMVAAERKAALKAFRNRKKITADGATIARRPEAAE